MSPRPLEDLAGRPAYPDERYFHTDLPELEVDDMRIERECRRLAALQAALQGHRVPPWILERIECIDDELRRRGCEVSRGQ
ncbi:MAG TPA: hypothetical protein VFK69_02090 [Candidatus Eisenbacteria bacterium]|nr:hypothetical protein [Candidatus Eisenbacteria bacterium]